MLMKFPPNGNEYRNVSKKQASQSGQRNHVTSTAMQSGALFTSGDVLQNGVA